MPPLGIEARMNRLADACEEHRIRYRRLLFKATEHPSFANYEPDLVTRLEWAFEQLTGRRVPTKSLYARTKAKEAREV